MGPKKKPKPNPDSNATSVSQAPIRPPSTPASHIHSSIASKSAGKHSDSQSLPLRTSAQKSSEDHSSPSERQASAPLDTQPNRGQTDEDGTGHGGSWYRKKWPTLSKTKPIAQIARESASAASSAVSEIVSTTQIPTKVRQQSSRVGTLNAAPPRRISASRSLPSEARTTVVNISSSPQTKGEKAAKSGLSSEERSPTSDSRNRDRFSAANKTEDLAPIVVTSPAANTADFNRNIQPPITTTEVHHSWLNWFSSSKAQPEFDVPGNPLKINEVSDQSSKPINDARPAHTYSTSITTKALENQRHGIDPQETSEVTRRSWLSLWATTDNPQDVKSKAQETPNTDAEALERSLVNNVSSAADGIQTLSSNDSDPRRGSWGFWSQQPAQRTLKRAREDEDKSIPQTPIQTGTHATQPENVTDSVEAASTETCANSVGISSKPIEGQTPRKARVLSVSGKDSTATAVAPQANHQKVLVADSPSAISETPQNLVLPQLRQTFRDPGTPSWFESISRVLTYPKPTFDKSVRLLRQVPHIKKALAIGVHGSVLGQPTGTSVRFADAAESAIQRWTRSSQYSCEIAKIALEGEGRISERIDLLWKLMLNWLEDVRTADFIMVACHSQGVPVALMLLAKLISFGCVSHARIGVCAMAGVNLGPFTEYKSRWISGSAGELFEFGAPESQVSLDYESALNTCLNSGVRITYVGSIDDQLVSLESSTFGPLDHPNVYRAVFINGKVHAPDFITHLVGFALQLRNLGISDHGLIRELSSPLAGSLYGGEGHSRIYEEALVYDLAIQFALETMTIDSTQPSITHPKASGTPNPYILPFAIRGVLEEDYVRSQLHAEVRDLLQQFDEWKPATKVLKDVKFRLEG
ncbi:hypothetical protein MMC25_008088, partial [Agyrium rufum]|nr:hypothetical protein [Agyrium rufum]